MRNYLFTFFILLSSMGVQSQSVSDSAQVHRDYYKNTYWLTLRLDNYFKSGSYVFFEANLKNNDPFYSVSEVNNRHFMIGYELKASDKWYLGASLRHLSNRDMSYFVPRVNITHRGVIKKIDFIKELSAEQMLLKKYYAYDLTRVGIGAALGENFKIGKTNWYAMLSYRTFLVLDLKNGKNSYLSNRKIDLTRLRFDLIYRFTPNMNIGVFAMRETAYGYILGSYDMNNVLIHPDYKENNVGPTYGLTLNYILKPVNNKAIIPGLPFR